MLTRRYPRYTGEYFIYSYALVFTNRFWTLIMSGMLLMYLKPRASRSTIIYEYSFPAISNMLSSWCQYEALRYVSFPATTLFKSFKLAPVMAMGKILGNKNCTLDSHHQSSLVNITLVSLGLCFLFFIQIRNMITSSLCWSELELPCSWLPPMICNLDTTW